MMVQVGTDRSIDGSEELTRRIYGVVVATSSQFAAHLTRVDVRPRDESAGRSARDDHRCLLEERPSRQDPVVNELRRLGGRVGRGRRGEDAPPT